MLSGIGCIGAGIYGHNGNVVSSSCLSENFWDLTLTLLSLDHQLTFLTISFITLKLIFNFNLTFTSPDHHLIFHYTQKSYLMVVWLVDQPNTEPLSHHPHWGLFTKRQQEFNQQELKEDPKLDNILSSQTQKKVIDLLDIAPRPHIWTCDACAWS